MWAELFDRVVNLSKSANDVQVVTHKDLPDAVFVRHGGELREAIVPPRKRAHEIHTFGDLMMLAADTAIAREPEIFHSNREIVVLLDRLQRRELVRMPLIHTERWNTVCALGTRSLTVAEAIKLIRFSLQGVGADALVAAIRKIDFSRKSDGQKTVEHGRETLGKQVEAAVQQADSIPQEFTAKVQLYANEGLRSLIAAVKVGVYIDVNDEAIQLIPLADEIPSAIRSIQSQLHELIVTAAPKVPVFTGEVKLI
jgi:hypothetical protein